MNRRASLALVIASIACASTTARADIDGNEFTHEQWGLRVSLSGPGNWSLSEERSYPSVWLWMVRRDPPGRMLLSAERVNGVASSLDYATRTSTLLGALGFSVRKPQLHSQTGAYWVDFDNGQSYLRQAFLVIGDVGFALTLSASDSRTRGSHLRAFDAALRSITIRRTRPQPSAGADEPPPAADGNDDPQDAGAP